MSFIYFTSEEGNRPLNTDGIPTLLRKIANNLYNISQSAGGSVWGSITGTLSNQTDLQNSLNSKVTASGGSIVSTVGVNANTQSALDAKLTTPTFSSVNLTEGGTVAFANTSAWQTIYNTGSTINGGTLNLPSNATSAVGQECSYISYAGVNGTLTVAQAGGGFTPFGGITPEFTVTPMPGSVITWKKVSANTWIIINNNNLAPA